MQTISGLAPVYTLAGDHGLSGEKGDYIQTEHSAALALAAGTIALTFTADTVEGRQGLFSKDGRGYDEGGHLTAWIKNGELLIRQQSDDKSEHLKVKDIDLKAGTTYHLAVSFGQDGLQVYLNGQLVAAEPEFKQGLELNDRAFVVGASGSHRSEDGQNARNTFEGTISDVMVFDSQLSTDGMAGLAGAADPAFGAAAAAAAVQADLMPAFQQLHHGSDE
ncbi:concanavalin A-like lectin/glucanase superfamily protein, partial [Roseibium hamelinense]